MQEILNKTLSNIVTENYQAAQVFEKYGLDFCCKGKRPLKDACVEKQIDTDTLIKELNTAIGTRGTFDPGFTEMSVTELSEYIIRVHHSYIRKNAPQILQYLSTIVAKHGDTFPHMKEVYTLFATLNEEMAHHMMKEEKVLFPNLKDLDSRELPHVNLNSIQAPIDMLEQEHDSAGSLMSRIRVLTNDYTAPDQACTTHRMTINALKGFEEDLHQHVHLENNILFPKALRLLGENNVCSLN